MGKQKRKRESKKKSRGGVALVWVAIVGVLGLAIYGVSSMSGVAYSDRDIKVVNFSGLDSKQKTAALVAANNARCSCGCGLGLAQCVSTDPSCPIRDENIELIKGMVKTAMSVASPP